MQEEQFDELNARVDRMDDKKLDIEAFNGWTQRVDGQFDRILAEQQRSFDESEKSARDRARRSTRCYLVRKNLTFKWSSAWHALREITDGNP